VRRGRNSFSATLVLDMRSEPSWEVDACMLALGVLLECPQCSVTQIAARNQNRKRPGFRQSGTSAPP
jgi:hypothetical protein